MEAVGGTPAPGKASGRYALAYLLLVLGGAAYGLLLAVNRFAADAGVPFLPYVFWQSLGACALLFAFCLIRRRLPPVSRDHLRLYALMGITGHALPWSLLAFVAPKLPVGVVALGLATVPFWVYAIAVSLGMDRFRWLRLLGMALGFTGVLLIVLPATSLPSRSMVGWVFVALAPLICFAVTIVASERMRPPEGDPFALSCGLLAMGTLGLLPALAVSGQWWMFAPPFDSGDAAVLGAVALVALLWPLLFEIVRMAGPVFFSSVSYLDTLAGVGWGLLFFSERHSPWIWAALVLLLAGLYLVTRGKAERRAPAS